jgi:DNA-binding SARP family transcriptional activator
MDFQLLGPIEVRSEGQRVDLGPAETAKCRCILAVLLRAPGDLVPTATVLERVWGERTPTPETRYKYIGWLRGALEPHDVKLETRADGYLLTARPDDVDLHRFRHRVTTARGLAERDPASAAQLLREADDLWQGQALTGATGEWADRYRDQLHRERRDARLLRAQCQLTTRDQTPAGPDLIQELREWQDEWPHDEDIAALLIRALRERGQTSAALEHYRLIAERLRIDLGTRPGATLASSPALVVDPPAPSASTEQAGHAEPRPHTSITENLSDERPGPLTPNPAALATQHPVVPRGSSRRRFRGRPAAVLGSFLVLAAAATAYAFHPRDHPAHGGAAETAALARPQTPSDPAAVIEKATGPGGGTDIGRSVFVTVNVVLAPPPGDQLWLMVKLFTQTPVHPIFYAKVQIKNQAGVQVVPLNFFDSRPGSSHYLTIVAAAPPTFSWFTENLRHDGDPHWDLERTHLPGGAEEIADDYDLVQTRQE